MSYTIERPQSICLKVSCPFCTEEVEVTINKKDFKEILKMYKHPPPPLYKGDPRIVHIHTKCRHCNKDVSIPVPKKEAKAVWKGFKKDIKIAQREADKYQEQLLQQEMKHRGKVM